MANFFKHSVKVSPVERQLEAPYEWYPHSAYNASSFGGTYHVADNITTIVQYDDVGVLENDQGASNKIYEVAVAGDYSIRFLVAKNTGDNDFLLKFDKISPIDHSGYSWHLGVNEIWATSVPVGAWEVIYAKGFGVGKGHSKVSFMLGIFFSGGG